MHQKKILILTLKELDGIEYFACRAVTSGKTCHKPFTENVSSSFVMKLNIS